MLIRFSTRYGQFTMFGEAALALLRLAGHSASVPGAILAAELPGYLERLRDGLAREGDTPSPPPGTATAGSDATREDDEARPGITLRTRALPLLEMMENAVLRGSDLMWERG